MVDIEKAENKRQMYWQSGVGRLTTIHLSLFLRFFQMSTIPRAFGLQL